MSELVAVNSGSIPHEIMEEIICRLPVKALHRFRCVASSFNSLVSEYRLARKHLSYATKHEYTHFLLYDLPSKGKQQHIRVCPLSSIPGRAQEDSRDLVIKLPDNDAAQYVTFMNSYNGLLCLGDDQSTFVYNLSSGTCTRVPETPNSYRYIKPNLGIGYDSTKDDYIIIKLFLRTATEVWMYSFKGKSWQRVGDFPMNFCPLNIRCIFTNGLFHWMAICVAGGASAAIDPTFTGV